MDKQDKRVVRAAVAVAIAVAIAILAVGWFIATRDDPGERAGDPAPAGPVSTAGANDSGRSAETPVAAGASPAQSAESGTGDPQPATPGQTGAVGTSQTAGPAASPSTGEAPAQSSQDRIAGAGSSGTGILTDEQVATLPPIQPPSFDVVRVNELGDAVIAGRAEPRAVVIIYDGDKEIGRVAADSRGEWVFVSDRPLTPGQHEIGLLAQSGPQSRLSDEVVVLIAPEPRQDIAGRPSEGDRQREKPLALLVPRDEIGATTVLQSPPATAGGAVASGPARESVASSLAAPLGDTAALPAPQPSDGAPVSIDIVDYDESGRLIVSGRSAPQADVRLYLDNEYVGTARAGADGSFQVQPADPVEPGVYALRIDEVAPGGSVTARAETPFQRATEVAAIPGYSQIIVQPGNSLWRIARRVYGEGIQFTVIYQANTSQIRNPDLIYPGQIFNVPEMPSDVPGGDPS